MKSLFEFIIFIELAKKPALEQEIMEVKWKFYKFIDFGTSIYSPKKFMEHLWCFVRYWENMEHGCLRWGKVQGTKVSKKPKSVFPTGFDEVPDFMREKLLISTDSYFWMDHRPGFLHVSMFVGCFWTQRISMTQ